MPERRVARPLSDDWRMKHRYGVILVLIAVLLIFQMAAADVAWSRSIVIALEGTVLVLTFHASPVHRALRRAAETIAVIATIAGIVTLIGVGDEAPEAFRIINVAVIATAPPVIVWGVIASIREHEGVTVQAVAGVLCVYLLIGMVFASIYGACADLTNEPFFTGQGNPNSIADYLYFSYSTLTTTGYGDLNPAGNLGRSFAILEQLIGAIYLVTVVAVLVSNLRPRQRAT
jgi:hypothetical protein